MRSHYLNGGGGDAMRILVDAMGGDNAPEPSVYGSIDAINSQEGFEVALIGDREQINRLLDLRKFSNPSVSLSRR